MKLDLLKKEVQDEVAQENFLRIERSFNDEPMVRARFKFFEVTFGLTTSTYPLTTTFKHNLKFTPQDVVLLNHTGGTITFNYASFTSTHISVTVSARTTARFFLGRYEEGLV